MTLYHPSSVVCDTARGWWPPLGVTLRRTKTPLVAASHWEHNWLWPGLDLGNKTPESRARDVRCYGRGRQQGRKYCVTYWGGKISVLKKVAYILLWMSYSFSWVFVCGLTVAVFLTKNPNLTLSQFWPAAPAEMRNSPLPTNGSFRQEIYVKKTLQHSPGKDVYIISLFWFQTRENQKHSVPLNQTVGLFCEMRTQLLAGICLKSASMLPTNA